MPLTVMSLVGVALCIRAATRPLVQATAPIAVSPTVNSHADSMVVASWAARAPFRRTRRPAGTAFDALRIDAAAAEATAPPRAARPQLVLRGVIMGITPAALIEGLPGVEGMRAVRQGERIGSLQVQSITRTLVRITGEDTTWNLAIREAGR